MLELKPNCELCDQDLAPDSTEARICSYECTFCASCVSDVLANVCPNCGGGFERRPIRPKTDHRHGVSLAHQAASTIRVASKYSRHEISEFIDQIKDIAPEHR